MRDAEQGNDDQFVRGAEEERVAAKRKRKEEGEVVMKGLREGFGVNTTVATAETTTTQTTTTMTTMTITTTTQKSLRSAPTKRLGKENSRTNERG